MKTECSGLPKGIRTPTREVENKYTCQSCVEDETPAKRGFQEEVDTEIENNITNKGKVDRRRKNI